MVVRLLCFLSFSGDAVGRSSDVLLEWTPPLLAASFFMTSARAALSVADEDAEEDADSPVVDNRFAHSAMNACFARSSSLPVNTKLIAPPCSAEDHVNAMKPMHPNIWGG